MLKRHLSLERTTFISITALILVLIVLSPFFQLEPGQTIALDLVMMGSWVFVVTETRMAALNGTLHNAVFGTLVSVILATLCFASLYPTVEDAWVVFLILPFTTAMIIGVRWILPTGILSIIGYLGVMALQTPPTTNPLNYLVSPAIIFTLSLFARIFAANVKQRESQLRESEIRFQRMADHAQDIIFRFRFQPTLGVEYVSASCTEIAGYTAAEFYVDPKIVLKQIHPEDLALLESTFRAERMRRVPIVFRWKHKDGRTIWLEERSVPIYDRRGDLVAVEGIVRDATRSKQIEIALQSKINALQNLSRIEQSISSELSLTDQIDLLLDHTLEHLHTDFAAVSLIDPTTHVLNPIALKDLGNPEKSKSDSIHLGQGAAGWIAENGNPLAILDVAKDARWNSSAASSPTEFVSYLGAPLQIKNRVMGVIDVMTRAPREFTPEEIDFLTALAARASIAIQNARLLEETQQRAMELQVLRQASLSLNSSLDLTEVLNAILENTMRIATEAQNTHIYLYQDNQLIFGASLWSDGRKGQQWSEPRENGLTYTVARQGEMIVVPDMPRHPLFENTNYSNGAILGLPLKVENQVVGVMNVAFARSRTFNPSELRVLELLGDQAATAISNARLHQTIQDSEERYRSLLENTPIGIYRVTPGFNGKFLMANPTLIKMFGFESLEELQQINVSDLYFDPAGRNKFSDLLLEKGAISDYEQRLKKKDGTPIWVLVTARAIYRDNQPVYFDCTSMDITARKNESIARAQAEESLHQRTRELEALLQVASSAANLDMETVITDVATRARDLLKATEATVFLMDEKDNLLRPIVALGDYRAERLALTLKPGEGIVGWVAQHRQAVVINHGVEDSRIKHVPGTPEEDESLMLAPMLRGDQLLGIILLNRLPATGFTQSELDLLIGMAAQTSAAVANARLFEETRRSALEQRIVSEISRALNASLDVVETFPLVVKGIRALADCDRISLALLDPDNQYFTMVMLDEPRPELSQGTRLPISATACANDVLAGVEHITPDLGTEANFPGERALYEAGYRSRVNLPLIAGERSKGALNLVSRRPAAFSYARLGPLQQIANTIAIALENVKLFRAELTRREELGALYSLSRQLSDINHSETILRLVTQHVVQTVHVTFSRILLIENGEFVVRAAYPIRLLDHDLMVNQHNRLAHSALCQQVLDDGAAMTIHAGDPRVTESERLTLFLNVVQTVCLIPLQMGDLAIGIMMLGEERSEEREPFTSEKIRLARNIGDQAASALHRVDLFDELEGAYLQTVLALANAVDAKDSDTNVHSQRLSTWALGIGKKLGMSPRALEDLRYGAILHDIGKIGVPDAVLKKPAELSLEEWTKMHQHPVIGARIIEPLPRLAGAAAIVRHHHERYDGTGYPDGLAGDAIPIGARVLTVVDSYGAIIDKRVYKDGWAHEQAIAELKRCAGTQFDPRIVELFLEILSEQTTLGSAK